MPRRERGFALTELLVVVIILGILSGIAIVTYLQQRDKAVRSTALSTLRNVRIVAEDVRADNNGQFSDDEADYDATDPGAYAYRDEMIPSDGPQVISVWSNGTQAAFAVRANDDCFYLRLGGEEVRHHAAIDGSTVECTGAEFSTGAGDGWG